MTSKIASILDYSYPFLDPAVWDKDKNLFAFQKDFILRLINKMNETYGLKQSETWVEDIVILGSLTTSKWLLTSDMDVHIRVNLDAFIASNMPGSTREQAFEKLDLTRKEFDRAKILAPMTQHPIEFYFESIEFKPSNVALVGVYSILQDIWLKEPITFDADLDFEESKKDVVAQAEALAEELDSSLGKIRRDIQRVDELEAVIQAWGKDKQQLFYSKVEQKLKSIEEEIIKDLKIKQDLVDARHADQNATSEIEIKFKWLARFGFFGILSNLKTLLEQTGGEVTTQELPLIEKIISQGSIKEAGSVLDINGTKFYKNPSKNQIYSLLKKLEYPHIRFIIDPETRDLYAFSGYSFTHTEGMRALGIPPTGFNYQNFTGDIKDLGDIDFAFEQRNKKVASIKEAFLKQAFDKQDICVDLDKTIAQDAEFPKIGDPVKGAKEALEKLQDLGYNVVIYTCRADTEEGIDLVREYLDKHEIPYDSIFEGEKPFAKFYIDDHAIKFDNWDSVLKQVEKSDKKASLCIARLSQKYWIDPQGKEYPVDSDHGTWIEQNIKDIYEGADWQDQANAMIRDGWTRITTESDYDFAIEVNDINNLPSYLDNFIASHYTGGGVEIDDMEGNYQDISDPFPSLRKTIYQARRLRNAASLFSKRDIVAKTKKVKQGDYSCLMALVPHDLAQEIVEWGVRNVPDEDLYLDEDGKLGRELESHITIKYGLLTNNAKHVRRSFNDDKPFHAKLGKVRHFQPPELPFDVLTVEVISEDLQKANKKVCDSFECAEGLVSDEYKPHITIAYMKRDKAHEYVGFEGFDGKEVELDTVIFSPHKGNRTYFSISNDKESSFILEQINKTAGRDIGYWIDPNGEVYDVHASGLIHNEWVIANLEMLHDKYGLRIPIELYNERLEYYKNIEIDDDNVDIPAADEVWKQMIQSGWVRIGDADEGIGVEINDLQRIPPFVDSVLDPFIYDGDFIRVEDINHKYVEVEYPFKDLQSAVNKALSGQPKTASGDNFLPSLFNAPNNEWQFEHGGDDQEIGVDPDPISDETTWYAPCTEGKPRTKEVWRQFLSMFQNPFSKKEEMTIESSGEELVNIGKYENTDIVVPEHLLNSYIAIISRTYKDLGEEDAYELDSERSSLHTMLTSYIRTNNKNISVMEADQLVSDFAEAVAYKENFPKEGSEKISYNKELEEKEKDALGEDQTLLEYSKGFYDPKKHDFPHNTTWDSLTQDGEPSKPTSVTYSPQISNEDNLDQNSPGGFPRRYMGKPKGEWFSDEGEVVPALQNMWKYRNSILNNMTRDITASYGVGYWIDPNGKAYQVRGEDDLVTHSDWIDRNKDLLVNEYGIKINDPDKFGHIYFGTKELVKNGWTRVGDSSFGYIGIDTPDLRHLPASSLDSILSTINNGKGIILEDLNGGHVEINWIDEVYNGDIQKTVNKALSQKRMGFSKKDLQKVAITRQYALYVGGRLAIRTLTHQKALKICQERFPEFFARGDYEVKEEAYTVSKQASWEGGWIDPKGKFYSTNDHENFIKGNPARFGLTEDDIYAMNDEALFAAAYGEGWTRVRNFGNNLLVEALSLRYAKNADAFVHDNLDSGIQVIELILEEEQRQYTAYVEDFKEEGWDAFIKTPPQAVMAKTAGDQSASVPDYLINEWKTEQINNDTDEEPYVNHDQRDTSYGFHDSPENTGTGIGWNKDNQPSVVHLDTLENPAYRLDPFGIGSYNVIWYSSLPQTDGLESTNPD